MALSRRSKRSRARSRKKSKPKPLWDSSVGPMSGACWSSWRCFWYGVWQGNAALAAKRLIGRSWMTKVTITVNGRAESRDVEDRTLLVQFLRENLSLTGTHVGCDTSQCGACVVHMD